MLDVIVEDSTVDMSLKELKLVDILVDYIGKGEVGDVQLSSSDGSSSWESSGSPRAYTNSSKSIRPSPSTSTSFIMSSTGNNF